MKGITLLGLLIALTSITSFSQSADQTFNENNYSKISQGKDPESGTYFQQLYIHKQDTARQLRMLYADSSFSQLVLKKYEKSNIAEGPFFVYHKGNLVVKGENKGGALHGERTTYQNGTVVQQAFFDSGKKKGTWQGFLPDGKLKRKVIYDNNENISSVQEY